MKAEPWVMLRRSSIRSLPQGSTGSNGIDRECRRGTQESMLHGLSQVETFHFSDHKRLAADRAFDATNVRVLDHADCEIPHSFLGSKLDRERQQFVGGKVDI